ncbi:MAG: hypothetical protein AAGJ37_15085 [Pseudomonadota bacterium]
MSEPMGFDGSSFCVITKPMQLADDLRHNMHEEIAELVSRYAELSERYYIDSSLPQFNLVICDYSKSDENTHAAIINISGFH